MYFNIIFEDWIARYGPERFFVGADVREEKIAVGGWLETTNTSVFDFIKRYIALGTTYIFCTDISKDGTLNGPATELYTKLMAAEPQLQLVASGGVKDIDCLHQLKAAGWLLKLTVHPFHWELVSCRNAFKIPFTLCMALLGWPMKLLILFIVIQKDNCWKNSRRKRINLSIGELALIQF